MFFFGGRRCDDEKRSSSYYGATSQQRLLVANNENFADGNNVGEKLADSSSSSSRTRTMAKRRESTNNNNATTRASMGLLLTGLAVFGCASAFRASSFSSSPSSLGASGSTSSRFVTSVSSSSSSSSESGDVDDTNLQQQQLGSSSSSVAAFPRWSGQSVDRSINLLYVKTIKTASTTIAGITRRIGLNHGIHGVREGYHTTGTKKITLVAGKEPYLYADHRMFKLTEPTLKNLDRPTFLYTSIRDPVSRVISAFQYVMDPNDHHGTTYKVPNYLRPRPETRDEWEARLMTYLQHLPSPDLQTTYIESEKAANNNWSPSQIVDSYDLVLVVERFDESVVVLKTLLGLTFDDVLYLRSKEASYEWGPGGGELSKEGMQKVKNFMKNSKDYDLLKAANKKLDEHIAKISNFHEQLHEYTAKQNTATTACQSLLESNPKFQCLYEDQGCGSECLSQFAKTAQFLMSGLRY